MTRTVRTSYVSPTDTRGGAIRVTEAVTRIQRTYAFDHAQRDMHDYAAGRFAREVFGMASPVIEYDNGRQPQRGYRFTIRDTA